MKKSKTIALTLLTGACTLVLAACNPGSNEMPITKTEPGRVFSCVNAPVATALSYGCSHVNGSSSSGNGSDNDGGPNPPGQGCHQTIAGWVDSNGNTGTCSGSSSGSSSSSGSNSSNSGGSSNGSADDGTACPPGSFGAGTNNC
jgi:hypothetical protein